jgi:hypothetical protein
MLITTHGTYPWSFVTQILHNGQPSHGGDYYHFTTLLVHISRYLSKSARASPVFYNLICIIEC